MSTPAVPLKERKRVKVYELRDSDWFDRGTGFCTADNVLSSQVLYVEGEEDSEKTLLEVEIRREEQYQKQQDTLIVWSDADAMDMALSFQEADGCHAVFCAIVEVQARLPATAEEREALAGAIAQDLPPAELGNLSALEAVMRRANVSAVARDKLAHLIVEQNYLGGLGNLVEMAEDLESLEDLHRLCNIVKTLILFNLTQLVEYLASDEVVLGVVGALEYDPDFPTHKANHRAYLSDASKFKEVVPIESPEIRRRIHLVYRLQYLKDVVLARVLDDPTFGVMNSLIFFNQVQIVQHIQNNSDYLKQLFQILDSPDSSPNADSDQKKNAFLLIQQSCGIAKHLAFGDRASLYSRFIDHGLFKVIAQAMQHNDPAVRVAGTDIFVALIDHDAGLTRRQIYAQINENTRPMTDTLVDVFLSESDLGVKAQIADAIKVLLDPNANGPPLERALSAGGPVGTDSSLISKMRNNVVNNAQADQFLQHFYDKTAKRLFQPLQDCERRKVGQDGSGSGSGSLAAITPAETSTYVYLIEILGFFLRQHSHRAKLFILTEALHSRVALLMSCPEKHLKLTALKYLRATIHDNDEHHNRHFMTHKLFEPILQLTETNLPRNNLLASACLELFEFLRRDNRKSLILHLVDTFRPRVEALAQQSALFGSILQKYEIYMHPPPHGKGGDGRDEEDEDAHPDSSFLTSDADTPNTRQVTVNGLGGIVSRFGQGLQDPDPDEDAYFRADEDSDDDEDELSRDTGLLIDDIEVQHPLTRVRNNATANGGGFGTTNANPANLSPTTLAGKGKVKPLVDYGPDDEDDEVDENEKQQEKEKDSSIAAQVGAQSATDATTTPTTASSSTSTHSDHSAPRSDDTSITTDADPEVDITSRVTPPASTAHADASSASQPSPPKMSLSEKRRREEDDDEDELGKLAATSKSKKRHTASSTAAPTPVTAGAAQPSSTSASAAPRTTRQSARLDAEQQTQGTAPGSDEARSSPATEEPPGPTTRTTRSKGRSKSPSPDAAAAAAAAAGAASAPGAKRRKISMSLHPGTAGTGTKRKNDKKENENITGDGGGGGESGNAAAGIASADGDGTS